MDREKEVLGLGKQGLEEEEALMEESSREDSPSEGPEKEPSAEPSPLGFLAACVAWNEGKELKPWYNYHYIPQL